MAWGRLLIVSLLSACVLPLGGCGAKTAKGPSTVPVRGKIVFTKGGDVKNLFNRQGRIELESLDQPGMRAAGAIEEDGSFTVATVVEGAGSSGAVAGKHRVRLDLDDRSEKLVAPQFLSFDKSGITITLPTEQPIEVNIWR